MGAGWFHCTKTGETIHIKFNVQTAPWSGAARWPLMKRKEVEMIKEKEHEGEILKIYPSRQIFTYKMLDH